MREEVEEGRVRAGVEIALHHLRHFLVELRTMGAVRIAAVGPHELPDAGCRRIDVVELVHDRVELCEPGGRAGIERRLARPVERLVAEAREHEGNQVGDPGRADAHLGRLGHEPLGSPRELPGFAVAPEVIAGLALGQRQAVTGRERSLRVGPAESPEHQHFLHIDEGQPGCTADDIVHQERDALGVVDHRDTPNQTARNTLAGPRPSRFKRGS